MYREFFSHEKAKQMYEIIEEARQIYKFPFVDKYNFDELLDQNDFQDVDHLNSFGAKKFAAYMNEYIMKLEKK